MRYLLLGLPLIATACGYGYGYDPGYAQGFYGPGYSTSYASSQGYYDAPPSSRYASNNGGYVRPYVGGENCGTPYEPKGCPPLPRHPLPYYPGDRY